MVALKSPGAVVRANFGDDPDNHPFVCEIAREMAQKGKQRGRQGN